MRKPPPDLDLFSQLKERILHLDPVSFCEHNLRLDGAPFRLQGNGYKPFADVYRYIGLKAIEENSKPVVMVKGRQVGATTMGAALELYFMASGAFGTQGRPPMRLMHLFPSLPLAAAYTKDKLSPMLHHSRLLPNEFRANGMAWGPSTSC